MNRSHSIQFLLVLAVMVMAVPAFAQGPAPPPAQNEVPLDGLSTLLLAAGAAYGGRKLLKRDK
jgi:photosystem II stability/assembly factor-like uncharacterized protein